MGFPRTLWTDKGLLRILRVHPSEVALAETAGHKSTAPEALPSSERKTNHYIALRPSSGGWLFMQQLITVPEKSHLFSMTQ